MRPDQDQVSKSNATVSRVFEYTEILDLRVYFISNNFILIILILSSWLLLTSASKQNLWFWLTMCSWKVVGGRFHPKTFPILNAVVIRILFYYSSCLVWLQNFQFRPITNWTRAWASTRNRLAKAQNWNHQTLISRYHEESRWYDTQSGAPCT